jgi:aerobic carbon-monoxide dehydrogenase medium subunit
MQEYDYHAAGSLAEAIDLLGRYGDDAHLLAGGTSFLLMHRQGLLQPGHVVGLRGVKELSGIRANGGGLEIGATTTHRQVVYSAEAKAFCPTLTENFSRIATVRIRNQATVGGNLVHADPAQDPPPMLLALDAEVTIAGPKGERTVPLDGFFEDIFQTAVQEGEVLKSIKIPPLPAGSRTKYVKFLPRTEDDYATVAVAARLQLGTGNRCEDVRIGLGAAAPIPMRAKRAESALRGQTLTPALIDEAAALAREEVDPLSDVRGSANYKREMARVWVGRALKALLEGDAR